ncbi:MAG: sigma-54 dependent transcriptional regulator [Hyphomicrobiales bacterium]
MGAVTGLRILVVEALPSLAQLMRVQLETLGHSVHVAATAAQASLRADARELDLVVLDPAVDGVTDLKLIADIAERAGTPVIAVSANGSIAQAVAAMRAGAADYLAKPVSKEKLAAAIDVAVTAAQAVARLAGASNDRSPAKTTEPLHRFIGASSVMQEVYRRIRAVAGSSAPVFITGESGTGKELAAEAIHALSRRSRGPLVAINCGAIPHELMESEIFGHVKGAFTGAIADRVGAAKLANGGTLFLDEICELDPALQTKLLRFVQTGIVQPVGSAASERVDVRIVCATNRSPLAEVRSGRFREDLYFRLHVLTLHMPPLKARGDDVLALAANFLKSYAQEEGRAFNRFSPDAEAALRAHGWPGNVRELQNAIRQAVVLHEGSEIEASMLGLALTGDGLAFDLSRDLDIATDGEVAALKGMRARLAGDLKDIQRSAIEQAIAACGGSVPKAARMLGVAPSTVYRRRGAWDEGRRPS